MSTTQKILFGIGLLASALTLGSLLGALHWVLDVLSHFHIQYAVLLLVAMSILLLSGATRRTMLVLLPALLINLYLLTPFFVADQPADAIPTHDDVPALRIMSLNISTSNAGYPKVVDLINIRKPDIIFMSEVRDDLVALLQRELSDSYPMQYAEPSRFTLGVAILARDPAVTVQTISADADMGRMRRRYLHADFVWEGIPVTLAGIHPLPPMRGEWAAGRNREIAAMGQLAVATEHPFILVGDLNASPWSVAMHALTAETDLRYAADGYGIWPTWYLGQRFVGPLLGAPLDHILVSPQWAVVDYTESGSIGSDHVPLQAELIIER